MPHNGCPTCGRAFKKVTAPAPEHADTATMSETQVRAYYALTAPREDARAFLRNLTDADAALVPRATDLLQAIEANGGRHTPATKREYQALHQAWRAARPWPTVRATKELWPILYRTPGGTLVRANGEAIDRSHGTCVIRPLALAPRALRAKFKQEAA